MSQSGFGLFLFSSTVNNLVYSYIFVSIFEEKVLINTK